MATTRTATTGATTGSTGAGRRGTGRAHRRRVAIVLAAALLTASPACAAYDTGADVARRAPSGVAAASPEPRADSVPVSGPRLIRTAWLDLECEDLTALERSVRELATEAGGRIASAALQADERLNVELRVPGARLDEVLERLSSLGEVTSTRVTTRDASEEMIDLEARLANLVVVRDRLRGHLDRADDVKGVLAVEKELARVQGDLDSLEARLEHLRGVTALAAVHLSAERPTVLGPLGHVARGVGWMLKRLFVFR